MTRPDVVSAHGKTQEQFVAALVAAYHATGLTPRTSVIRAGTHIYTQLLRSEIDGPHTTMPGVGWMALELDDTYEPWSAAIIEKETP